MSTAQAVKLRPEIRKNLRDVIMHNTYEDILIFASGKYLEILQPFSEWNVQNIRITIADARLKKIGQRLRQMKKWAGVIK
jgi:hypothetical protein